MDTLNTFAIRIMHSRCGSALVLLAALFSLSLLSGCSSENSSFLDPQGPIAEEQRAHLINVTAWTMIAIVPVFVLVPVLFWRYRYRNKKARYTPNWAFSGPLDLVMWGVPFLIIAVLSVHLWNSTHALDPYKPIASAEKPLNIQVVGLDWKWLFIYPDLGIATVNEFGFPGGSSVSLDLTTDTVMQSFMIPSLAGQIYAMPGMRTKLHIMADKPGTFLGENVQFSGMGFTEQKFAAVAMSAEDFATWVADIRAHGAPLDQATYGQLATASTGAQTHDRFATAQMPRGVTYFNQVDPNLFASVLGRYMQGTAVPASKQPGAVGYLPPSTGAGTRK